MWGGKQMDAMKFQSILQTPDEQEYFLGVVKIKGKNADELKKVQDKFVDSSVWKLTKVHFVDDKANYINSPIKLVIDLSKTTCTFLMTAPIPLPAAPTPPAWIKDILTMRIQTGQIQKFDAVGVVSFSQVRYGQTPKGMAAIVDVQVVDGSETSDGKKAELAFTLFHRCTIKGDVPESLSNLLAANGKLVAMFSLIAQCKGGSLHVNADENQFSWIHAKDTKKILPEKVAELQSLSEDQKQCVSTANTWQPRESRDYVSVAATPALAAILDAYSHALNAKAADDSLFQLNYVEVETPGPETNIFTKDNRIWIARCTIFDLSGSIVVSIREKAVLSLAGLDPEDDKSRALLREQHAKGELQFPMLSSLRVHLTVEKTEGDSQASTSEQQEAPISKLVVVEAAEQDLSHAPNLAFMELISHLTQCQSRTDSLAAAHLDQIEPSAHYPLQINYGTDVRPCAKALVLLVSTQKSQQEIIDTGARRLTTPGVVDGVKLISTASESSPTQSFTVVGMCSEKTLKEVLLDPPRSGKKRLAALAIIGGVASDKTFFLQNVHLLSESELLPVAKTMKKLIYLNSCAKFDSKASCPDWSEPRSGILASAKKARKLGCNPTDASLPDTGPTP